MRSDAKYWRERPAFESADPAADFASEFLKRSRLEYIGAVQDLTQRRLSEEALSQARSELAKVAGVTSLEVLAASIAREVNQPLSGIITNASTCLRMLSADPPTSMAPAKPRGARFATAAEPPT